MADLASLPLADCPMPGERHPELPNIDPDDTILPTSCGRCGKACTTSHHVTRAGTVDKTADCHHRPHPTGRPVPWPVKPVPLDVTDPEAVTDAACG